MLIAEAGGSRRKLGPDGKVVSEETLHTEAGQIKASLATIDARIEQTRNELRGLRPNSDEQDIWETNLVMLQVCTLLFHANSSADSLLIASYHYPFPHSH